MKNKNIIVIQNINSLIIKSQPKHSLQWNTELTPVEQLETAQIPVCGAIA